MNVAFIPVRGGSKSIPLKNIKKILGQPLVYWTAKAACDCKYIDKVYVASDNQMIRDTVESFKKGVEASRFTKLFVIERSKESASDFASTEFAMLEFASSFDFKNIVLIQATSPLLSVEDLNAGFEKFNISDVDSVLSVVRQKRFNWSINEEGYSVPVNYDFRHRPRRQEFDGYLVENGAFYITSKSNLIKSGCRISGNIKTVEMGEDTFFEIDEPSDWGVVEALMKKGGMLHRKQNPPIKMFLTDCDGCLTDGGMYYSESGDEIKKFNTRDGMGISLLKKHGIITGIITSESVEIVKNRAKKLKLDIVELGCENKLDIVVKLCEEYNISLDNVCYVGDDVNDFDLLKCVGYACCPYDAIDEVKSIVDYVSLKRGGEGAIRDIADRILGDVFLSK